MFITYLFSDHGHLSMNYENTKVNIKSKYHTLWLSILKRSYER